MISPTKLSQQTEATRRGKYCPRLQVFTLPDMLCPDFVWIDMKPHTQRELGCSHCKFYGLAKIERS